MVARRALEAPLKYRCQWWALGVFMVLIVAWLSLSALPPQAQKLMLHDKLVHFAVYAILAGWFGQLVRSLPARASVAVGLLVFGMAMELLQAQVPGRFHDLADMLANSAGVVMGMLLTLTPLGRILEGVERRWLHHGSA